MARYFSKAPFYWTGFIILILVIPITVAYIYYGIVSGLIGTGILLLGVFFAFVFDFELIVIKDNAIKKIRLFKKKEFPFETLKTCAILEKAVYIQPNYIIWPRISPQISNKLYLVFTKEFDVTLLNYNSANITKNKAFLFSVPLNSKAGKFILQNVNCDYYIKESVYIHKAKNENIPNLNIMTQGDGVVGHNE